jgi:arylsulfatase A-like enzyme
MIPDGKIRSGPVTRDIVFLPEYFKRHGYHTMGIGKLFHIHAPKGTFHESGGREKGFGPLPAKRIAWDGLGESKGKRTSTDWGAFPDKDSQMPDHRSADWAIERLGREYDKPFFLAVGMLRPHVPWHVPRKWFDLHPLSGIELPPYDPDDLDDIPPVGLRINDLPMMPTTDWARESGEWRKIIQSYLACVSFVDHEIGRVMDALDRSEHADDTLIVLWSDHGYRLGEKGTFAKHALWEPATKAPLLFAGPGVPAGKVLDSPVELLSIYPTLLELCGLPAYGRNEGRSLVEMIKSGEPDEDACALTTFGMNNHAVRSAGFRYIRYEDGGEELYDHRSDPNEWENLAGNPDYSGEIEKMKALLPKSNAKWDRESSYEFQTYFIDQKERTSGPAR